MIDYYPIDLLTLIIGIADSLLRSIKHFVVRFKGRGREREGGEGGEWREERCKVKIYI